MSPFETAVEGLGRQIRPLSMHAQGALFIAAARALEPEWRRWSSASGVPLAEDVFHAGVRAATAWVLHDAPIDPGVLAAVERSTPFEPTDVGGFTPAQDCWICLDTALRGALGEFDPADSAWYLLEPLFQRTSERLLGFTEASSAEQETAEAAVLADPSVATAVAALECCLRDLASRPVSSVFLDNLRERLAALCP